MERFFGGDLKVFITSFLFFIVFCGSLSMHVRADGELYTSLPKKPDILVNIHVGKTGGSTMNAILAKHYSDLTEESVNCADLSKGYPLESIRKLQEDFYTRLSPEKKARMKTTGGHVGTEVLNFFPKGTNVKAFAIVRDPKGLIVSHFWYAWQDLDDKQKGALSLPELDKALMDFILHSANYNNDTVRWFSRNNKFYDNRVPLTEEEFEAIKTTIKNDFLFVGLSHRFDETLIALRRLMGWPFDEDLFYKVKNKTEFKMPEASYPDSILSAVKDRFSFEKKLYSWLEQRFDSLTKLLGDDFEEEVRVFKRLNYLYQTGNPIFEAQLQKVQTSYPWASQSLAVAH